MKVVSLASLMSLAAGDAFLPRVSMHAEDVNITADGIHAYIYLYPLVLMAETEVPRLLRNKVLNKKSFANPGAGPVVSPNVDTLYTQVWFNLEGDHLEVLSMPDTRDRYYVMQYIDAWTNTFAGPGKRLNGTDAKQIALVGPDFKGDVPSDVSLVRSPTNLVWLLGRIQVNSADDIPAVNALQDEIKLAKTLSEAHLEGTLDVAPPPAVVAAMDAKTFFTKAADLLKTTPPAAGDTHMIRLQMARIGISPGMDLDWDALPASTQQALEQVPEAALAKIAGPSVSRMRNGWTVPSPTMGGPYGTDYLFRAMVAMGGLGANQAAEAIYLSSNADGSGDAYDGDATYTVTFAAGELPPVKAFWSLTMYDQDHYLVPNDDNKYAIGDRDDLIYHEDGSLVLTISSSQCSSCNWLPAPAGQPFLLLMRLYWPVGGLLDGSWVMPGVQRQVVV